MMQITVDSRRCGAGKTTGANGIYEILRENYSNNQPTLLVLPSIGLADDYQKEGLSKIKKINSDNRIEKTIELDLLKALVNNEPIIAITKQAFINIQINDGLKRKYSLIIDEAFDTWDFISYEQDKDDKMFIDWKHLCHVSQAPLDNHYVKINLDDLLTNSFTKSHHDLRRLSRKTFDTYMLTEQQQSMQKGKQFNVVFIQELKKEVLDGWEALHIAASRFEMTFMSLWMMKNDLNYSVLPGCEFEKHDTKITIHYPDDGSYEGITWSKNKRNNNQSFLDEVHTYVKNNIKEPALTLLNNSQEEYIPNGIKAKHNEAGSNNFIECKSAVLESTLNPDNYQLKWLTSQVKDCLQLPDSLTADDWVFNARTGYTYYQILMRTQLRVNKPVDVFVIDHRAVVCMADLFNKTDIKDYAVNEIQKSVIPVGRPASGSLEPKDRMKASKLKKKYPEMYNGMSAREILDSLEKSVT